jgi:hypothetical protein
MLIWEYISGELSSKKTDSVTTRWLSYEDILKLTYLENTMYTNRYSMFLERVIDKSVNEINIKSDLHITYETLSERGRLTHIRFLARRKNSGRVIDLNDKETIEGVEKLKHLQLSSRQITEIQGKFTEEEINNAYEFFMTEFESASSRIRNPVAFFKKALEEGWVTPEIMTQRVEISDTEKHLSEKDTILTEIQALAEADQIKVLRIELIKSLGVAPYKAWMNKVSMKLDCDTLRIITPTSFHRDWIESHYRDTIQFSARFTIGIKDLAVEIEVIDNQSLVLA